MLSPTSALRRASCSVDDQPKSVVGARSAGLHAERWTHDEGVTRLRTILDDYGIRLDGGGEVARQ